MYMQENNCTPEFPPSSGQTSAFQQRNEEKEQTTASCTCVQAEINAHLHQAKFERAGSNSLRENSKSLGFCHGWLARLTLIIKQTYNFVHEAKKRTEGVFVNNSVKNLSRLFNANYRSS